jgi:dihydroorotate dehydrogenase electron transfer subunit
MPVDVAAEVVTNRRLSHDYNVLTLAAPAIAAAAGPGQFVMVRASDRSDPILRRPFSVFEIVRDESSAPVAITLLNKRVGVTTGLMYEAQPGQRFDCLGPLGIAWMLPAAPRAAYLVAGGVGLAAFATFAQELSRRNVETRLFYGARTGGELFYLDFFRNLGVQLVLTTEDGTAGEPGRVTGPLERRLEADPRGGAVVYACGPEPMMAAATKIAMKCQAPAFVSMERIMGCGLGGCYSCVVPVRTGSAGFHHIRSCIAGPTMPAESIIWD